MVVVIAGTRPFTYVDTYGQLNASSFSPVTDAGGVAGELMVVFMSSYRIATNSGHGDLGNPAPTTNSPTGWSVLHSIRGGTYFDNPFGGDDQNWGINTSIQYKRLDGTETGSANFESGGFGVGAIHARCYRFTGGGGISVHGQNQEYTSGNPSQQDLLASALFSPLIIFAAAMAEGTNSTLNFSNFTPTYDTTHHHIVGNYRTRTAFKIYNTSPLDTAIDLSDSGPATNALLSAILKG